MKPFHLERYFARYEFSARWLLSSSDCDGLPLTDLLAMADAETRALWDHLTLGYTESLGHPLLREEIAGLYSGITPDQCLVATPEEGIFIALNTLLRPGDHMICTFPGYQSHYELAEGLGCHVTRWLPEEEHGWRFNPDFLEQAIQPNTRLVLVNFPHNPTGAHPSRDDFQRMVEICRRHNLMLFSDEMYRLLEYDPAHRLPAACEVYEKAISLFGMSKTFGLAGLRIGWLVTPDADALARMAAYKDYTTICSSAPSEILSIIALRAREQIINRHLARIGRNLKLLDGFFEEFSGRFQWIKPLAGTIAFPRLTAGAGALDFCQRVVSEANIMLLPSTVYDYDDAHFRIGFGRENLPEALERLSGYLRKE